jgi:hypothetical protein
MDAWSFTPRIVPDLFGLHTRRLSTRNGHLEALCALCALCALTHFRMLSPFKERRSSARFWTAAALCRFGMRTGEGQWTADCGEKNFLELGTFAIALCPQEDA